LYIFIHVYMYEYAKYTNTQHTQTLTFHIQTLTFHIQILTLHIHNSYTHTYMHTTKTTLVQYICSTYKLRQAPGEGIAC